jgi:hypothetical protein
LSSQATDLQRLIKQFTLLDDETGTATEYEPLPVRAALPNIRPRLDEKR